MLLWTFPCKLWAECVTFLGYVPRSGIAKSYGSSVAHFEKLPDWFPKQLHLFYIPTSTMWQFWFFHTQACYHLCFYCNHPWECEVSSHHGFDVWFPSDLWCWASVHRVLSGDSYIYVLGGQCLFISSVNFLIDLSIFYFWVMGVLYIYWIQVTYRGYQIHGLHILPPPPVLWVVLSISWHWHLMHKKF